MTSSVSFYLNSKITIKRTSFLSNFKAKVQIVGTKALDSLTNSLAISTKFFRKRKIKEIDTSIKNLESKRLDLSNLKYSNLRKLNKIIVTLDSLKNKTDLQKSFNEKVAKFQILKKRLKELQVEQKSLKDEFKMDFPSFNTAKLQDKIEILETKIKLSINPKQLKQDKSDLMKANTQLTNQILEINAQKIRLSQSKDSLLRI